MTQSGQTKIYYWTEATPNQIPAAGAITTAKQLRCQEFDLDVVPQLQQSTELTPGNEPQDQTEIGKEGTGNIPIVFSPRNFDDFFANLLWNSWAYQTGNAGNRTIRASGAATVTWDNATRTLTTSATWTVTPAVGDQILVWGSSNAYLNGIHRVESATSTTIVLEEDGILSSSRVPAIAVAQNITIVRGERLTNSLTPSEQSMGFERQIERTRGTYAGTTATAGSPTIDFKVVTKVMAQRIQLQSTAEAPFTGQISVRASNQRTSSTATSPAGASVVTSPAAWDDTPVFQGANNVKKVRFYADDMFALGGNPGKIQDTWRVCPESLTIELENGLQETKLMCAENESDFQQGGPLLRFVGVGIYESPFTQIAFERQVKGVFEVALVASNGEGYLFKMPRSTLTANTTPITPRGTTLKVNFTAEALRQPTPIAGESGRAVEIYRFRAP